MAEDLTIVSWNACGLGNKKIEMYTEILDNLETDIACIQETLTSAETKDKKGTKLNKAGYKVERLDKGRGRGLAIFIKTHLNYEVLQKEQNEQFEFITIKILRKNRAPLAVTNLYLRPTQNIREETLRKIFDLADENHIITGDFNAHHSSWGSRYNSHRGKKIKELAEGLGYEILNTGEVTRISSREGTGNTMIDLTLVSTLKDIPKIYWKVHDDTLGSDHLPQIVRVEQAIENEYLTIRQLKFKTDRADWVQYRAQLEAENWEATHSDNNEIFLDRIEKTIKRVGIMTIPNNSKAINRKVPVKATKRKKTCYWWTEECQKAKDTRKKWSRAWQKSGDLHHLVEYRKARNQAKKIIDRTRQNAWVNHCTSLRSDTADIKETWRKINLIDGKTKSGTDVGPILKPDGSATTDNREKANVLADNYENISSDAFLDQAFLDKRDAAEAANEYLKKQKPKDNSHYNQEIKLREIKQALRYKKDKATGEDAITYSMLRHLPEVGLQTLLKLFNQIYSSGILPQKFKSATIIPIHKPDKNPKEAGSYRPISLTSHIGKTLETIIKNRLTNFLEAEKLITKFQTGFRGRRQALEQVIRLETDIHAARRTRSHVTAVFLDLEKAFDVMWRGGVLEILNKYNVTGQLYNYIQNFLQERSFQVRVGQDLSEVKKQKNGTPQGSVLSPILFTIAVNEVAAQLKDNDFKLGQYADDIAIWSNKYRATRNGKYKKMERNVNSVIRYLKNRGFKVNSKKTQAVHFNSKKELTLNINGAEIQTSAEAKYLGVTLDKFLTFKKHIEDLTAKGNKTLNLLYVLRNKKWSAPQKTLKIVYKNLVEARINYGQEVYANGNKQELDRLDRVHGKALRILTRAPKSTSTRAIQVVTGEPPPDIKRSRAQLHLWARVNATLDNPTAEALELEENIKDSEFKQKQKRKRRGIAKNLAQLREALSLDSQMIAKQPNIAAPHLWTNMHLDTRLSQEMQKKVDTVENMQRRATTHINDLYRQYIKIATDGSKELGLVGIGVYCKENRAALEIDKRISDYTSITTAELVAILQALKVVENRKTDQVTKVVILTDSLAAIQALEASDPKNKRFDIIAKIRETYDRLAEMGHIIVICWTPAHVGVEENEEADKLAKQGAGRDRIDIETKLGSSEMKALINARARGILWNERWTKDTEHANFTRKLIPNLRDRKKIPYGNGKYEKITRLRLGNPYFVAMQDKYCDQCKSEKTIQHVLLECEKHRMERNKLMRVYQQRNLPLTLTNILSPIDLEDFPEARKSNLTFINSLQEII